MWSACASTVFSLTISSAAISRLVNPRAISSATCRSRAVSGSAVDSGRAGPRLLASPSSA
jgi:hypothetical protein